MASYIKLGSSLLAAAVQSFINAVRSLTFWRAKAVRGSSGVVASSLRSSTITSLRMPLKIRTA